MNKVNQFRNIYIDQLVDVSGVKVVEDGGLVEVRQVGHVFAFLKLGRIDLLNLILFQDPFLLLIWSGTQADLDGDLVALGGVDDALDEAAFLQGNPA